MSDESPHWNEQEIARLRALFAAGRTDAEIAAELPRRTERAVAQMRHRSGLVRRRLRRRQDDGDECRRCEHLIRTFRQALWAAEQGAEAPEVARKLKDGITGLP